MSYAHHDEVAVIVAASPVALFERLDDQERLAAHMKEPSTMMMGGRMFYEFDSQKGRAVGSVIRMGGAFLGLKLVVEEVVTVREPPRLKVWETRGSPRLIIIDGYRMGFAIEDAGPNAKLRVFIDYDHSNSLIGRLLAPVFAPLYARWCVRRMAEDAQGHFAKEAQGLQVRPATGGAR
jgi:hypothetical protein